MGFSVTHRAQAGGAPTWPAADPAAPPGPRLDPGLEVQVLAVTSGWAQVRCANGWEAWTDLRWLEPAAAGAPVAAPADRAPARAGRQVAHAFVLVGSVLGLAGAFLPWLSSGGASIDGFDVNLWALATNEPSDAGPTAGLVVVVGAIVGAVLVAFAAARPFSLPGFVLGGVLVFNPAAVTVVRWAQAEGPRADLGVGIWLVLVGGVVALVGAAMSAQPQKASPS